MNRDDYLKMLDSNMGVEEIAKILQQREAAPIEPINWKTEEHLETDFTKQPAMPIEVDADVVDRPASQRMFGSPIYDQNGDLRCRSCGAILSRSMSGSGEGIACCSNIGCQANGFAYAEGSYTNNPHRRIFP
jgi:hypothetical protein